MIKASAGLLAVLLASSSALAGGSKGKGEGGGDEAIERWYKKSTQELTEVCGTPIVNDFDHASFKDHMRSDGPVLYFRHYALQAFTTTCTNSDMKPGFVAKVKKVLVVYDPSITDGPGQENDGSFKMDGTTLVVGVNDHTGRKLFEASWHYLESLTKK
jgi:hypothetical protein